jgi:hypothetical protein
MQLIPFDPSKGGSKAGYCLQNVRLGYSIPALYNDAWQAWNNTEQHKNRNFPTGDVPLYYDYTDSGGNRYGHINVRLADGRLWNDGSIFASLEAFENTHRNVKFVGWGESINNIKVIKQGDFMTEDGVRFGYLATTRKQPTTGQLKYWIGRPSVEFTSALYQLSDAYLGKALVTNETLTKTVAIKDGEIERLNKEIRDLQAELDLVGDDTKNLNAFGELLRWFVARMGRKG